MKKVFRNKVAEHGSRDIQFTVGEEEICATLVANQGTNAPPPPTGKSSFKPLVTVASVKTRQCYLE